MQARNHELPLPVEIRQVEQQLRIYDALVRTMGDPHEVLDILVAADDAAHARAELRERLGFDEVQASAVMDVQFRRTTKLDRHRVSRQRQELLDRLDHLTALARGQDV